MTFSIGPLAIGYGHPCALIGELSNNANGKYENAVRLLDGLKAAGASAAKVQCYSADELVALRGDGPAPAQWSHLTMRELYSRAATPFDWFSPLFDHARRIGLPLFSSVFGAESLAVLESCGCPAYKIAALDSLNGDLVRAALATGKPVIVSCREVDDIEEWAHADREAHAYLQCPPGYPTKAEDVRLAWAFEPSNVMFTGISSHCLDSRLPIAAVARGARLLEYHVQLDDEPSELEENISLTVSQFRRMVEDVRTTETLLGSL